MRPLRRAAFGALLVAAVGHPACGTDDSLAGSWTGAVRDNSLGGLGGANFTFRQSGSVIEGSWEFTFRTAASSAQGVASGSLSGTVEGNSISAVLRPQGPCVYSFQATRSGKTMTGSYDATGCSVAGHGTVDLEKQSD